MMIFHQFKEWWLIIKYLPNSFPIFQ